jgi:hypothetical protein
MHNQGEALQSALETNVKPMAEQAAGFEQQCHAVSQNPGNLTPDEVQSINAACARLESAAPPFRAKFSNMAAGLSRLEQVYQQERSAQQRLVRESERLQ